MTTKKQLKFTNKQQPTEEIELIDLKKEEPPENKRRCTSCGKTIDKKSEGKLIHWPNKSHVEAKTVKIITGEEMEPFSFWVYTCRWCRGIETKRKNRKHRQVFGTDYRREA